MPVFNAIATATPAIEILISNTKPIIIDTAFSLDTIISIIIAGITLIALIVAMCSNNMAQQQLRDALKIHEQAKAVELYEHRYRVLDDFSNEKQVKQTEVSLLFASKEIQMAYAQYTENDMKLKQARFDLCEYARLKRNSGADFFEETSQEREAYCKWQENEEDEKLKKIPCYLQEEQFHILT